MASSPPASPVTSTGSNTCTAMYFPGGPSNGDDNNCNDNDDDDDETLLILAALAIGTWYTCTYILREPKAVKHPSALSGVIKVEELLNGDHDVLFKKVRMDRDTFKALTAVLEDRGFLRPTRTLNVDEQLFIFLTILGQTQTNLESQDVWKHSIKKISRWFGTVLEAICAMKSDFIKPPNYDKVQKFIRTNGHKYRPWFDNCVGAIDGTHVDCKAPLDYQEAFRNKKGNISMNVMAVCSFDMKFTYMLSGWEGSVRDSRVLQDALSDPTKGFTKPPPGKFYLVDSGYANQDCFLAPYPGSSCRLQDYRSKRGSPNSPPELFNYTHSSLRNCIERTIGAWKARFPILKRMHPYSLEKQVKIPVACAAIHNIIRIVRERDELLTQYHCDGVPVSEIDPDNAELEDSDVETVDDMADDPLVRHDTEMSRFRDEMADQMWRAFAERPWYK